MILNNNKLFSLFNEFPSISGNKVLLREGKVEERKLLTDKICVLQSNLYFKIKIIK